jgi:hypothetical protein
VVADIDALACCKIVELAETGICAKPYLVRLPGGVYTVRVQMPNGSFADAEQLSPCRQQLLAEVETPSDQIEEQP